MSQLDVIVWHWLSNARRRSTRRLQYVARGPVNERAGTCCGRTNNAIALEWPSTQFFVLVVVLAFFVVVRSFWMHLVNTFVARALRVPCFSYSLSVYVYPDLSRTILPICIV